MAHGERSVTIAAPAEAVFDYLADGRNNSTWRAAVLNVEPAGDTTSPGAVTLWRQSVSGPAGLPVSADYRVVDAQRPLRYAIEVVSGPARPRIVFTIAPLGPSSCQLSCVVDLDVRGALRLVRSSIDGQIERELGYLDALSRAVEQRSDTTDGDIG